MNNINRNDMEIHYNEEDEIYINYSVVYNNDEEFFIRNDNSDNKMEIDLQYNMPNLPNEIIDYIILNSDYKTIINNRNILTNYAYNLSLIGKSLYEMIYHSDIEALNYNCKELASIRFPGSVFDTVIIHSNPLEMDNILEWAYKCDYKNTGISIKLLLILDDPIKTKNVLNFLKKKGYISKSILYKFAVEWSNYELLNFLIENNIPFYKDALNIAIYDKNYIIIRYMFDKNLLEYNTLFTYIAESMDKEFILKLIDHIPIYIHCTYKRLVETNVCRSFISWLLEICLYSEKNIFINETMILYKDNQKKFYKNYRNFIV